MTAAAVEYLVRRADTAMCRAGQSESTDCHIFDPEQDQKSIDQQ